MAIGFALFGLSGLIGLVSTVLYIVLLVKVFKHAGVGLGILGIFCGPFTYVWGWVKSGELGLKKLMIWLTLTLVASTLVYLVGSAVLFSSPEFQEQVRKSNAELQKTLEDAAREAQQPTAPAPAQ